MAPVKKQKVNKLSNVDESQEKEQNIESVVSGQLQKKINKKQRPKDQRGVVFIKHLPHGFFEEQLKKYFEQFGNVTRVRLARSKRTGNSKGYAFVEFEYPEVAEVAAETMDNYLMFKQVVKASYIPPEKQQFNFFRTSLKKIRNKSGKGIWVSSKTAAIHQKMIKHNNWSEENYQKRTQKQLQKLKKIGGKFAHLGIDMNKIIVQPKILTEKEKVLQEKSKMNEAKEKAVGNSKAIKTKTSKTNLSSKENTKKSKNEATLQDLLGNTIEEESDDEDYVAMSDSEDGSEKNEESSDESTYNFALDKEDEGNSSVSSNVVEAIKQKKSKNNRKKITKSSNAERVDQMLKLKPNGGINKLKKQLKKPTVGAKKSSLQITAAKELAKPLSKIQGKLIKPLKTKKSLIKVK